MFSSFFPKPLWFLISAIMWSVVAIFCWYQYGSVVAESLGLPFSEQGSSSLVGLGYFVSPSFLWFYLYFLLASCAFYGFWRIAAPDSTELRWSVFGSCGIVFLSYCYVQYAVAYNNWLGPYFDLIQAALSKTRQVELFEFYSGLFTGVELYAFGVVVFALNRFLISHWIFRWRAAMSDYYIENWSRIRHIEGASQRVQEDTMMFAKSMENIGVKVVEAIMTLIAFVPILLLLSRHITELPLVGSIPFPLMISAIAWALFGTLFLSVLGIRLPGLEFENQKVEAAFRKELVYGEDDNQRARLDDLKHLFSKIRSNYYRMYFHYFYFNFGRQFVILLNAVYTLFLLAPTIAAGAITLGIFSQIRLAFWEISDSLQCLIKSWPEVVDALSVYKRLRLFEKSIDK